MVAAQQSSRYGLKVIASQLATPCTLHLKLEEPALALAAVMVLYTDCKCSKKAAVASHFSCYPLLCLKVCMSDLVYIPLQKACQPEFCESLAVCNASAAKAKLDRHDSWQNAEQACMHAGRKQQPACF